LEQLALYGRLPERARAVESLAALAAGESIPTLATTMHAADASDRERRAAAEALRRMAGGVGSRDDAIEILAKELRRTMRSAAQRDNDGTAVTLWSVGPERRSIRPTESYAIVRVYRDGYDHAAQLRRVGELPADVAREALIADLSYRLLVDPDWGAPAQLQAVRQAYGAISDAESVARALDEAMQRDNSLAASGLLRMIEGKMGQTAMRTLLAGGSGIVSPLVRATRFGDPRVRYEAVAAIDRLSPEVSFPGIGRVRRTLDEMRELGEGPTVVLAETRGDLVRRLESILSGFGFHVDVVGSGRALERRLARGGDIRMIVSSTELNDFRPIELVDRVRRSPMSSQLPIVFYGDDLPEAVGDRWTGITASIPRPVSTAAFAPILLEMRRSRRLPEISAADRYRFRTLAESFGGAEG
jgi:CheY-like chemotaxis protein